MALEDSFGRLDELNSRLQNLAGSAAGTSRAMNFATSNLSQASARLASSLGNVTTQMSSITTQMGQLQRNIAAANQAAQQSIAAASQTRTPPPPGGPPGGGGGGGGSGGGGGGFLGGIAGAFRTFFGELGRSVLNIVNPFNILAVSLYAAISSINATAKALNGFSWGSRFGRIGDSFTSSIGQTLRGVRDVISSQAGAQTVFLSPEQRARTQMATTRELGGRAPAAMTKDIESLVQTGISPEDAAKLSAHMYRVSGYSATAASQMTNMAKAMATANGIGEADLLGEMAANANLLSNAANRLPGALAKAVIESQKMGVSLQGAEGFANRITGDFENYLDMQAKLQTVMPGVDMTNVMLASQYGSTDDVMQSLRGTFGGMDIGRMPRSIRQMITGATGISEEELVNYGKAGSSSRTVGLTTAATPTGAAQAKEREDRWKEAAAAFGMNAIKVSLGIIAAAAGAVVAGRVFGGVLSRLTGGGGGSGQFKFDANGCLKVSLCEGSIGGMVGSVLRGRQGTSRSALGNIADKFRLPRQVLARSRATTIAANGIEDFHGIEGGMMGRLRGAGRSVLGAGINAARFVSNSGSILMMAKIALAVAAIWGLVQVIKLVIEAWKMSRGISAANASVARGRAASEAFTSSGGAARAERMHERIARGLTPEQARAEEAAMNAPRTTSAAGIIQRASMRVGGVHRGGMMGAIEVVSPASTMPLPTTGGTEDVEYHNHPYVQGPAIAQRADSLMQARSMRNPAMARQMAQGQLEREQLSMVQGHLQGATGNLQVTNVAGDTLTAVRELVAELRRGGRQVVQVTLPDGRVLAQTVVDSMGREGSSPQRAGGR